MEYRFSLNYWHEWRGDFCLNCHTRTCCVNMPRSSSSSFRRKYMANSTNGTIIRLVQPPWRIWSSLKGKSWQQTNSGWVHHLYKYMTGGGSGLEAQRVDYHETWWRVQNSINFTWTRARSSSIVSYMCAGGMVGKVLNRLPWNMQTSHETYPVQVARVVGRVRWWNIICAKFIIIAAEEPCSFFYVYDWSRGS